MFSVLYAPNAKAVRLIIVIAVHLSVIIVQVAVPRIRGTTLGSHPPVAVVANKVERAGPGSATRKGREIAAVGGASVGCELVCGASLFEVAACICSAPSC